MSLEFLSDWGWINGERIAGLAGRGGPVNFEEVEERKLPLLYEAAGNFLDRGARDPKFAEHWRLFLAFCKAEKNWLNDYAMYNVLRREYNTGRGQRGRSRCANASRERSRDQEEARPRPGARTGIAVRL